MISFARKFCHSSQRGLAGLLAFVGGVLGCIDGGLIGLVAGALLGGAVGGLCGALLAQVGTAIFGVEIETEDPDLDETDLDESDAEPQDLESWGSRLGRHGSGIIGFAVIVTMLHDGYWLLNMAATTVTHNAGAYLSQATERGDSRDFLRDGLKERRWQLEVFAARPMRWLLTKDVDVVNRANLEIFDVINGKGIDRPSATWQEALQTTALNALWQSDLWPATALTDTALHQYGHGLCLYTVKEMPALQANGWILRFLPTSWFTQ